MGNQTRELLMARKIWNWIRWTIEALLLTAMVFALAATGVMFIVTDGSWIAVAMGYGCVGISVLLVTLMFLIVHTMDGQP